MPNTIKKEKDDSKMFDIFLPKDMHKLLHRKRVVFMGDSDMRALYKDFICLWHNSKYIPNRILQNKQESTVFDDKLVSRSLETNGRYYREEREARLGNLQVKFFYLTKVYSKYVEYILTKVSKSSYPDIIIMNSCLWDLLRWGHDGVEDYKFNLYYLFRKLKRVMPGCLIIWITTPPVGNEMIVSLVEELKFLKHSLHLHILEANDHAKQVVIKNGFNVLDIHNHWQMKVHQRTDDGMRWKPEAIRFVTNLLLTRISLSYNFPLPHRYESSTMEEQKLGSEYYKKDADIEPERKEIVNFQTLFSIFPNTLLKENSGKRRNLWRHYRDETVHSFLTRERKKVRRRHRRQWQQQQHISRDYSQPPVDSFVPNFGCNSLARNVYYYNNQYDLVPPYRPAIFYSITVSSQIPLPPHGLHGYDFENSCSLLNDPVLTSSGISV